MNCQVMNNGEADIGGTAEVNEVSLERERERESKEATRGSWPRY